MKTFVFYDIEYTTWEGAMERLWSGPGEYKEVVQIAAGRVDLDTMALIEEFDVLIRPQKCPVLSDYFIKLTGITQEQVAAEGIPLPEAFDRFIKFIAHDTAASYGADDAIIRENLGWLGLPENFTGFNMRDWFQTHGAAYGVTPQTNSGRIAAILGAPIDSIQEHNALHDVRSLAAGFKFLRQKGVSAPF